MYNAIFQFTINQGEMEKINTLLLAVDRNSTAYKLGYYMAGPLLILVVVLIVLKSRKKNKKQ